MASFKLLKSEVKPLTRELAVMFRDLEPSPTERELNPSRIKHLREKADAGLSRSRLRRTPNPVLRHDRYDWMSSRGRPVPVTMLITAGEMR